MRTDEEALADRLRQIVSSETAEQFLDELNGLRAEDVAEAIGRLELADAVSILQALDSDLAAYVLIELPTETARAVINELPDATVAHYLDILPMDDAMDLREELDPDRFESLLNVIPQEDAQEIRRLMSYPDGSAGQILTEDFVEVGPDATMAEVIGVIRNGLEEEYETVNYIYVLSEDRHLLGVLTLRRVLRAHPDAPAREVMNANPMSVPVEMAEEEVARILARYGFTAIPVLDSRGRIVGIITADDAQSVLQDAQTEDVLKLGGVSGDAEAYPSLNVWQLTRRRLPWLLILFVAEFLTGTVLRHYLGKSADDAPNSTLSLIAKLQLFLPLLIGAGGNSGSQVTTTITRALALGEVRARDWLLVIRREFAVATIIGLILGFIGFLRAILPPQFLGWNQPWPISLSVGLAVPCIIMWAATVGSMLPIGAKRLGIDPAVMSAPFISTFVDATGLIIFFEVARRVLAAYGLVI